MTDSTVSSYSCMFSSVMHVLLHDFKMTPKLFTAHSFKALSPYKSCINPAEVYGMHKSSPYIKNMQASLGLRL